MNGNYHIETIDKTITNEFLKDHHYLSSKSKGFLGKICYGLFSDSYKLIGVCVFAGVSAIETLIGAFEGFDKESSQHGFWELTRLAMDDEQKEKNLTSWFVSRCIRDLRKNEDVRAIISYADSDYHCGYIYQATNFKYYGLTAQKNDFYVFIPGGGTKKKSRGKTKDVDGIWKQRSRKHRYMIVYDKALSVKWSEEPYPKGDNHNYLPELQPNKQMNIFDYGLLG